MWVAALRIFFFVLLFSIEILLMCLVFMYMGGFRAAGLPRAIRLIDPFSMYRSLKVRNVFLGVIDYRYCMYFWLVSCCMWLWTRLLHSCGLSCNCRLYLSTVLLCQCCIFGYVFVLVGALISCITKIDKNKCCASWLRLKCNYCKNTAGAFYP